MHIDHEQHAMIRSLHEKSEDQGIAAIVRPGIPVPLSKGVYSESDLDHGILGVILPRASIHPICCGGILKKRRNA